MANFAVKTALAGFIVSIFTLSTAAMAQATYEEELIQEIIEINNNAQTEEEWHTGELPIRRSLGGLFSSRAINWDNVCTSLSRLSTEDLLNFYAEISRPDARLSQSCRNDLSQRVSLYMRDKNLALNASRPKLNPCRAATARTPQAILGPSLAVEMDNARAKTVTDGGLGQCQINFTFDDGPHSTLTAQLLDILAANQLRVNFFVLGKNASKMDHIVLRAASEGHIIGNHTMTHANLPNISQKAAQKEIADGFSVLLNIFSEYMPFFRFPYGASTKPLKKWAYANRWLDFFWTMDTLDWKLKDPEQLYRNVLTEIEREKKGVILFHDVHPQTLVVVPYVIEALNEAGYTSVVFETKEVLKSVPN